MPCTSLKIISCESSPESFTLFSMPPGTHLLISWSCANVAKCSARDRFLITMGGVAPDLDGLGYFVDYIDSSSHTFCKYHHIFGHNIGACIFFLIITFIFADKKILSVLFVALTFHIHMICDVMGGRGPDEYQWPIPYLLPFSDAWNWTWSGQWYLHAWQNSVAYAFFLSITFFIAFKKKISPVELISKKWDTAVMQSFKSIFLKNSSGINR